MLPSKRSLLVLGLAACGRSDAPAVDSARAAASPPPPPAVAPDSAHISARRWVVTERGIGPILAGVPIAALDTVLSEHLTPAYAAGSSCADVHPKVLPRGVLVMVQHDTVARVDVRAADVRTVDSVGVGDSEARVIERYKGRVRVSPHKYTGPTGHYLTVSTPPDTGYLLLFETDGKHVVSYRAGRRSAVELVEGCS